MKNLKFEYPQENKFSFSAKEVLKELDGKLCLIQRISIHGQHFPLRNAEPFIRILLSGSEYELSWFANIEEDQKTLHGYFPIDLKWGKIIEYGYGNKIFGSEKLDFHIDKTPKLDRKKIENKFLVIDKAFLKNKLHLE